MSDIVQLVGDEAMSVYRVALEFLKEHNYETNLKFPELVESVAKRLNITDEGEKKELDSQIRYFVRKNPAYKSKRGAGGGIALASVEAQREAVKVARVQAKADAAAKVEASLSVAPSTTTSDETASEDVQDTDEFNELEDLVNSEVL